MKLRLLALAMVAAPIAATTMTATAAQAQRTMPANTNITVTPVEELSSSRLHRGDRVQFLTVGDTAAPDGTVVIPRGSPVTGTITMLTGRGIFGKSGKFDVTWNTITVGGREYALHGVHHQTGRGNTVAAVFVSGVISGRSGRMTPGQSTAVAITTDAIPY